MDLQPGLYVCRVNNLNVRGLPDATHQGTLLGERIGMGKSFTVYEVVEGKLAREGDSLWGRTTPAGANAPRYVCLKGYNTTYATFEKASESPSSEFLKELYKWAKANGYLGPPPP